MTDGVHFFTIYNKLVPVHFRESGKNVKKKYFKSYTKLSVCSDIKILKIFILLNMPIFILLDIIL